MKAAAKQSIKKEVAKRQKGQGMESKIKAVWSAGFGVFRSADAQKVAEEIFEICSDFEQATPQQIVEKGRDANTELHKCFEWNDSVAAEKYRLVQARDITRHLVFVRTEQEVKDDAPEIRVFHKTERVEGSGYKPLVKIVQNDDEYQKMLRLAYAELHALKVKYQNLQELDYILSLIP